MKTLVAVAIALALVASGRVAEAYVAVVGTAISVPSAPDAERSARLEEAIWAAIRDVLEHAVAFTPTVVTIEDARIVGDRLYLSIFLSLRGASAGHRSVLPRGGGVVRLHGRWSVEDAHDGQLYSSTRIRRYASVCTSGPRRSTSACSRSAWRASSSSRSRSS